jgi:hypothetical protein
MLRGKTLNSLIAPILTSFYQNPGALSTFSSAPGHFRTSQWLLPASRLRPLAWFHCCALGVCAIDTIGSRQDRDHLMEELAYHWDIALALQDKISYKKVASQSCNVSDHVCRGYLSL